MKQLDRKHCSGCRDDFYNHNNMGMNMKNGKPECWSLKDAKLIKRKEININDRPPWSHQPVMKLPACYSKPNHVYVDPDRVA